MKNAQKGFLLGLLLAGISYLSTFISYYTSTLDYHLFISIPYHFLSDVGLPGLESVAKILFALLCGGIGYFIGKALDSGDQSLIQRNIPLQKKTFINFLKSYKWTLIIVFILLCIYPLRLYFTGMEHPGLLCGGPQYDPANPYASCVKNYAEIYLILKMNILYLGIFFIFIISVLKSFDLLKVLHLFMTDSIYRKTVGLRIILPVLLLILFVVGFYHSEL